MKYKIAECYTILKLDKDAISVLDGIPSRQRTPKVCFHTRSSGYLFYKSLCESDNIIKRAHCLIVCVSITDQYDAGESLQKGRSGTFSRYELQGGVETVSSGSWCYYWSVSIQHLVLSLSLKFTVNPTLKHPPVWSTAGLLSLSVKGAEVASMTMDVIQSIPNLDWLSVWIKAHAFIHGGDNQRAINTIWWGFDAVN